MKRVIGEALAVTARMDQVQKRWNYLSQIPLEFFKEDRDSAFQHAKALIYNLEPDQAAIRH